MVVKVTQRGISAVTNIVLLAALKARDRKHDCLWPQLLACIGEQFTEGDEICGIVVNLRGKQDKICLWTKDASNEAAQVNVGKQFKDFLEYDQKIGFLSHVRTSPPPRYRMSTVNPGNARVCTKAKLGQYVHMSRSGFVQITSDRSLHLSYTFCKQAPHTCTPCAICTCDMLVTCSARSMSLLSYHCSVLVPTTDLSFPQNDAKLNDKRAKASYGTLLLSSARLVPPSGPLAKSMCSNSILSVVVLTAGQIHHLVMRVAWHIRLVL